MNIVNDKMSDTPETDAAWAAQSGNGLNEVKEISRKLERERDEAREELRQWQTLRLWGGTPEHIHDFIKGQQTRIHEAQNIERTCEQLERERDEAGKELSSIHRWIERNHADGFINSLTYLQNLERVTDSWYDRIDAIETDARRFVRERDEARVALASEIALADRLAHNLKIASHAWNNPTEHPAITDWKKARHE